MARIINFYNNSMSKWMIQSGLINTRASSSLNTNKSANKDWVSYGFDHKNDRVDKLSMHGVFFCAITLCVIVGGFGWAYVPDYQMSDWAGREAYLEIRRRERAGLPMVDRNLVNPAKVVLPSDKEIDIEIVI